MDIVEQIQELILTYGLNILGAIAILIVGYWLAGVISRWVQKALSKSNTNEALLRFLGNIVYYAILAFAGVAALERVGVQTASFIAVLGAAGLAIGLALQGALSNFASGVMILLFKPFEIGHYVEINDTFGEVTDIKIFSTILLTREKKTVIIPNGLIISDKIINYSKQGYIRADMVFGIGYDDDLLKAKRTLEELVAADERVLETPAPRVAVLELADSSVNFAVRPYVKIEDYWDIRLDMPERVKLRFDEEGISIPYPQHDVHLFQSN
ncbi:mechanosensitive ion channel family protein [Candidatus Leptofilum sp.]|uniref:mechanosensitive ion channel family protein n=1 Tax=Candidatus Leptofilum sp. TaxID=3241576 RepID=UPI003B5C2C65